MMTDSLFWEMVGSIALILVLWSLALLWATWVLYRMREQLFDERKALRKWSRLREIEERQNRHWQ